MQPRLLRQHIRLSLNVRDDLVEVLHGLARLDHGEDENFVIRVLPIVGAAIEKRAVGAEAARAARRIAAGTD